MREVEIAWREDSHPEARGLLQQQDAASTLSVQALSTYLRQLIGRDIKLTPLKDLQGRIWRFGYASGELIAPLFADVPRALRRWRDDGFTLAVYSSGSVPAQQLLYGHCHEGDLTGLFSHWFDTKTGPKQAQESYLTIATEMLTTPANVLFILSLIHI